MDREILDISGGADRGERLNEIADQFRRGRDVNDLVVLLDSPDSELVSTGAWILGELHFELYNVGHIVTRLWKLVEHQDPAVRFHAFGALYPALNREEVATQSVLRKLRNDSADGVRRIAEAAAARLHLK